MSNSNKRSNNKDRYDEDKALQRTRNDGHPRADDAQRRQPIKDKHDVINDITDYFPENMSELRDGLNTYSFSDFMGTPIDMGQIGNLAAYAKLGNFMVIRTNPSATFTNPSGQAATDGINMAGLRNYTLASAENGKTSQYQPQDMTMLTLAFGSILQLLSHLVRLYGVCRIYNQRNRMYSWRVLRALGVDPDSLIKHQADYRNRLNYLIGRINQITIPKNVRYFGKCLRMYASIYVDTDNSPMAQSYALVPQSVWSLDETYDSDGSGLRTQDLWLNGNQTADALLDLLEGMIEKLLTSSTFNYIYSDFKRLAARGQLDLMMLGEVPVDHSVVPTYVKELEIWVNNLIILDKPEIDPAKILTGNTLNNDVKCDVNRNCIIYRPQFFVEADWTKFDPIINFDHVNPTIDEKFYATRLRAGCLAVSPISGSSNFYQTETVLPDFYVTQVIVYDGCSDTETGLSAYSFMARYTSGAGNIGPNNGREDVKMAVGKFHWHPYIYTIDKNSSGDTLANIVGDTQYFTTLAARKLKSIHDAAMLGECMIR